MILNILDGKPLPVYGDGENVQDWLFVIDHCDVIIKTVEELAKPLMKIGYSQYLVDMLKCETEKYCEWFWLRHQNSTYRIS